MDAYLFSTDHAGSYAPYLFVPDQNAPRPGHPDGKSWVPWKAVRLDKAIMDNDAEQVANALKTDGHFIAL
jgi:hypothetical protein